MIIVVGANIFRIYAIYRFMRVFFDQEQLLNKEVITYIFYFLFTTIVYWVRHSIILDVIFNILGLYLITCVYTKKVGKRLFVSFLVYLVNMACDAIVFATFTNYTVGENINEFYGVITSICVFLIELIAERIIRVKSDLNMPIQNWICLLCVPIISAIIIFLTVVFLLKPASKTIVAIIIYGILINNIVVFYLYNAVLKFYKIYFDNQILKKQVQSYTNQLELIRESQDKFSSLKHDLKHHIRMLKDMMSNQENTAIKDYIYELENSYRVEHEYVNSGNGEIDSILNYMLQKAHEKLNDITIKVKIPDDIKYNIFDLNVILGNLLENAIFSAEQSEQKWINILLYVDKGVFHVTIKNSYNGKLVYKNDKFLTTKDKPSEHGIGLENVKKIVEKYNGIIDIEHTESEFQVNLMLYLVVNKGIYS